MDTTKIKLKVKKAAKLAKRVKSAADTAKKVGKVVKVAKTAHTAYKIAQNPAWQLGKRAVGAATDHKGRARKLQQMGVNAAISGVKNSLLPARIAAKVVGAVATRAHAAYKVHQAKKPGRHNNQYTKGRM